MTGWLAPLQRFLDESGNPTTWWFRDDDVGWGERQLLELIQVFGAAGITVDLAAIPAAITKTTGERLLPYLAHGVVAVHQHGWAHANHQRGGRRSEFGDARSPDQILADLRLGQDRLQQVFTGKTLPCFTPPWNRCSPTVVRLLGRCGFEVLSCDRPAQLPPMDDLVQLPVSVDWTRHWRAGGPDALGWALSEAVQAGPSQGEAIGVMLHHEVMEPEEHAALGALLGLLADHHRSKTASISELSIPSPSKPFLSSPFLSSPLLPRPPLSIAPAIPSR